MAQHSVSGRATIAGTALRPLVSLYAAAAAGGIVRQIELTNTTATACCVALVRLTSAGTQGAALTEAAWDANLVAPQMTAFAGHTADLGSVSDEIKRASIAAAIGAGVVWVFGGRGLVVPEGTGNGVGVYVPTGTGQILDYTIEWEE